MAEAAKKAAGGNKRLPAGTVMVRAIKRVRDNGRWHEPGDEWPMDTALAPPHVAAGQVELADPKTVPSRRDTG